MLDNIINLINALTALFTIIGPIIMYVMKKRYESNITHANEERDILAKAIADMHDDPVLSNTRVWLHLERSVNKATTETRDSIIPILSKHVSRDNGPTKKASSSFKNTY